MGRTFPDRDNIGPSGDDADMDRALSPAAVAAQAGGWMARAAFFLALAWVAGVICIVAAMVGFGALGVLTFVQGAALAFTALLPAGLLLFAGATAREGARAQAQARRLADAADRMMNPSPVAEAAARRLGISVRGEIAALDTSLAETLSKLAAVEAVITRQKLAVDQAAAAAQSGAGHMVSGLERERAVLAQISADLSTNATRLGETILRQSQAIGVAAREAEGQLRAADQVLEGRLIAVGETAALIGERTGALKAAAASTSDSTQRLETALSGALDTLAQATNLTEAARKSTEAATLAANTTAGAVRDTTNRAMEDARRVAELIRTEAQTVEREAATALERLREAAQVARLAAVDAREATGAPPPVPAPRLPRPTTPPQRPFMFIQSGKERRDASRQDAERRDREHLDTQRLEAQVARAANRPDDTRANDARPDEPRRRSLGEQFGLSPLVQGRPEGRATLAEKVDKDRFSHGNADRWTWRDMLRSIDAEAAPHGRAPAGRPPISAAPNEYEAPTAIRRAPAPATVTPSMSHSASVAPHVASPLNAAMTAPKLRMEPTIQPPIQPRVEPKAAPPPQTFALNLDPGRFAPAAPALPRTSEARTPDPLFERPTVTPGRTAQMMETVGVRLGEVFNVATLDRIAARARNGTQARRRAVRDAAPEAVLRLAERFDVDPRAREEGARFLEAEGARIADLLGRGRASMSADTTRAFLLIDAASS